MEALIVTDSDKSFTLFAGVVRSCGDYNIVRAKNGASARRAFATRNFDLAVIGSVAGEKGKDLAVALAESGRAGVILLEDSFTFEAVAAELEDAGVIVIPRPVQRAIFAMALRLVGATNVRVRALTRENSDLTREIEDMKYINRAKYVLMESLGYSENQAHKYIERRAMDERKTRKEIAIEVLSTYGI